MTDWWNNWTFWTLVVLVLVAVVVMVIDGWIEEWFEVFVSLFVASMALPVAYFIIAGLLNWWLPHYDITNRYDLLVMNDKSMTSGQVVLGTGQVSETAGYSFYIDGGAWQQYLVLPGRNALVYQDVKPGEKPWVVIFNGCHVWGQLAPCFWDRTQVNEVHVPPGTIKPSLTLDAR